jgi:hypothetical protein
MSDFSPHGYERTPRGVARAARHWFADEFDKNEAAIVPQSGAKPQDPIEQAVRAFSWPEIPNEWWQIANQTVHRLRNLLLQGELHADYFDAFGRHSVPREFWATPQADGVLESGMYWPFGQASRVYEWQPNCYPLFLREIELRELLSEQPAEKRQLPRSKIPELVAALRELGGTRQAQYELLCALPQFRGFKITRADFREAARHLPREPGRKSRQKSRR